MSPEDPYATFKAAFEVQRFEIQKLYNRVSELEKVNAEVLSYVKRRGSLPVLNNPELTLEVLNCCTLSKDNAFKRSPRQCLTNDNFQSTVDSISPETNKNSIRDGKKALEHEVTGDPPTTGPTVLSDFVTQHAIELDKALETLGLEPSKRNEVVDQVRLNMNTILHNQLSREFGFVMKSTDPEQLSVSQSLNREKILENCEPLASSGGDGSVPAGLSISPLDALGFDKSVEGNTPSPSRLVVRGSQSSQYVLSSTEVQEKRRMELMRINHRLQNPLILEVESPPKDTILHDHPIVSCGNLSATHAISSPTRDGSLLGSSQTNNDPEPCSLGGTTFHDIAAPIVDNIKPFVPVSPPRHRSPIQHLRSCPCGNRQNCPLSTAKQRRFGNDSRVLRGFTLLAAVFRGRLVRHLLATNKVYDLIRTVKDTAKLALSLHVERQNSFHQSDNTTALQLGSPPFQNSEGLSPEELVLESRLMVQLRGALSQLHEIFFNWPTSNKLELLAISRSLPQRSRRVTHRISTTREGSHSTESPTGGGSQCEPVDFRRRLQSGAPRFGSRVLRQLQPHQIDRFGTPILATESVDRETKKNTLSTFGTDCISVQSFGNTNAIPRVMRFARISGPQSVTCTAVSERQLECQAEKSDTSYSSSKLTTVQTANQERTFIGLRTITRYSTRLHSCSVAHSSHSENTGSDDQAGARKTDPVSKFTTTASDWSGQLLQFASNVSSSKNRTSTNQYGLPDTSNRSYQNIHFTPSNPVTSSGCSFSTSNREQRSFNAGSHSGRSSSDADVENRSSSANITRTRQCDTCNRPVTSNCASQWSENKEMPFFIHTDRLSDEQNTVPDSQTEFRPSRIPSTRAILERSALAMAASRPHSNKEFRQPLCTNSSQHRYFKRSHCEALETTRSTLYPRSPILASDHPTGNDWYPVRRRIVASRPNFSPTKPSNSGFICYSNPVPNLRNRPESLLTQPRNQPNCDIRHETPVNYTRPGVDTTIVQPPLRRWSDDHECTTYPPQITRSPTRLLPDTNCLGTLRATWSMDSFNPQ